MAIIERLPADLRPRPAPTPPPTESVAEMVAASTAASGVPEKVSDPTTLARVARLLLGGGESDAPETG
jgi:hypothetical protein